MKIIRSKKFLFADLAPKMRVLKILELYVLPEFESDGFKLLKSGPSLKKEEGNFEWIVDFFASKWNSGNTVCLYNPHFTVRNKEYRKYLKTHEKLITGNGQISSTYGKQHWEKKIFSTDDSEAYFLEDLDFAKYDNFELIENLVRNIREVGYPFFRMMSEFDSIRNFYVSKEQRIAAPRLIDLCYVLNRKEEINSIIDWYYKSNQNCPQFLEDRMQMRVDNWLKQNI